MQASIDLVVAVNPEAEIKEGGGGEDVQTIWPLPE